MDNLTNITVIRGLMEKHGFSFSKSLGQNFLTNPSVCPRMAQQSGADTNTGALEIGPGIGVLTAELAKACRKVVAVEIDSHLLPVLGETLAEFDNVKIIHGDILKLHLQKLLEEEFAGMEVIVCANLPYYITSPIVMALLEARLPLRSITVLVQKEAAQRICAPLPSRQAGAITASIAYYAKPSMLFEVSRGSFMPAPEVDSAVLRLDLYKTPPVQINDERQLFRVIRGAFSQRRKTLLNCLSSSLGLEKAVLQQIFTAAQVNPGARAEALSLEDFARIANALPMQAI